MGVWWADTHTHTQSVWDCVFMLDFLTLNDTEKCAEAKKKNRICLITGRQQKKTQLLSNYGTLVTSTLCNLYSHYRSQNNTEEKGLHCPPSTQSSGCMQTNTFYINISFFKLNFTGLFACVHTNFSQCLQNSVNVYFPFKVPGQYAEQDLYWTEQNLYKTLWKSVSK